MIRIVALVTLLVACACWGGDEASPPASTAEPEGPSEVELVAWMEAHYTAAILAHDALVEGDLDTFRARLAELDTHELPENSPESWKPLDAQLHAAAVQARNASDLDTAAGTMAAVATACGACHEGTARGPVYPTPPVGEADGPTQESMRNHEWAVLMLWNGVTGPSEYAWDRGAAGLAETRIFGDAEAAPPDDPRLLALEVAMRDLGAEAKTTTSLADRATLYGRMLAICGDCHQALAVDPLP